MNCNNNKIQKSWQIEEAKMLMLFHVLKNPPRPPTFHGNKLKPQALMQLKAMDTLKRISEKHESEDVLFSVLDYLMFFHWFSLIFFQTKERLIQTMATFSFPSQGPSKTVVFQKKRPKKASFQHCFLGSGTWALPIFGRRQEDVAT